MVIEIGRLEKPTFRYKRMVKYEITLIEIKFFKTVIAISHKLQFRYKAVIKDCLTTLPSVKLYYQGAELLRRDYELLLAKRYSRIGIIPNNKSANRSH